MREIQHVRLDISNNCQYFDNAEAFQVEFADEYVALKNTRSDLLKKAYNFRKEHSGLTVDELDAEYLNMVSVLETLCAAEKEYDLLAVKVEEARHQLNFGEMSEHQFSALSDSCFTQQVEIDLTISKLREEFSNYVLYEIPVSAEATAQ